MAQVNLGMSGGAYGLLILLCYISPACSTMEMLLTVEASKRILEEQRVFVDDVLGM